MTISVSQIRSSLFNEQLGRGPRGKTGVREYKVTGAASLEDVILVPVPGIPRDGQQWVPGDSAKDLICTNVVANWLAHNRDGETNGTIKVTATYGPPEFAVINGEASPQNPGEKWTAYGTDSISQTIMYADVPGQTGTQIPDPIDNGRGFDLKIGVLALEICQSYAADHDPAVGPWLRLMRPPSVNAAPFSTPPLWGLGGVFNFAPGQLLYQGHSMEKVNNLLIVKHKVLGSDDWKIIWTAEDDKGNPRVSRIGQVYPPADFSVLE